jgi:hypothetical protein
LRPGAGEVRVVDAHVLLELLEGVVRARGEGVEAGGVEVGGRDVSVGQQRVRGDVVGGEAVEGIRQHLGWRWWW